MENIKVVLSEDLIGGKVHRNLQLLLKEEEEKDKNETQFSKMLQGEYFETEEEKQTAFVNNTCYIYTNFTYKPHFVLNHERKNEIDITENCSEDTELRSYQRQEETYRNEYHLALILFIIDENYIENNNPLEKTSILEKIEKLKKEHGQDTKIICLFIGIRELVNRTNYGKSINHLYDKSMSEDMFMCDRECVKMNNNQFDQLIATLLVSYHVDSIEMENDNALHKFIFKCCKYLYQSKIRKLNSYFKVKPSGINQMKHTSSLGTKGEDKNFSTWVSQLMQISGISEDISIKIAETFNTPFDLIMHFKKVDDEECLKDLIVSSSYGDRRLGKALSRKIFRVFSSHARPDNYVS
ncbi:hypothetical protein, conserved [Plasmodium gonderi]|uniref:Uncharacterized protein n=1 Tax=Plasmodium gonderi TaxID=77519 RepID=A0A1Y1JGT6_PLAGO|nr:hypothetical protein, conserved [Plasmodium gonderi]GAW81460.1 hypothetical protein, conserved [Plasmodium gonderi]